MLRSNSKAVSEKVKAWILENIDFSGYDELENVNTADFPAVCRALLETCEKEKFYSSYPCKAAMMADWFQGLPSMLDTAYYIYRANAVDLLGEWLEETESEKARYNESDAEKMINHLLIREILKGAAK